jgi:hypothetical protein
MQFELSVPPGAGYSVSGGLIRGAGLVIRSEASESGVGVALRFHCPLEVDFNSALPSGMQMGLA